MNLKKLFLLYSLYLCLFAPVFSSHATTQNSSINTADIVQATTKAISSCINYRISGVCFWLNCNLIHCSVETSYKISHFIPDIIVSSYSYDAPWQETKYYNNSIQKLLGRSGGGLAPWHPRDSSLRFKRVDVIGAPLSGLLANGFGGYLCQSVTTPYMPYFLSDLDDFAWRIGITEMLYIDSYLGPLTRQARVISSGNEMWGYLYPRTGFILQSDDYKAAAVTALRAANICSRKNQLHIYRFLGNDCGEGCWAPGEIGEVQSDSERWQLLSPHLQNLCREFDHSPNPLDTGVEPSERYSDKQRYAWQVWRKYSCCEPKGQLLLEVVDFVDTNEDSL